ncbi:MAG: UPF0182 family protein [Dehalococcoidia bacterium]|nr:UPF0182 family protein [Dehalococcoidia bacterium]
MSFLDEFERREPPRLSSILNWAIPLGALLLLWIGGSIAANIYVDWLWFDNLGYLSVFTTILTTRVALFVLGALVFAVVFGANVYLAQRYSPKGISPEAALNIPLEALTWARRLVFIGLIVAGILLSIVFGAAASGYWETALRFTNAEMFNLTDPLYNRDVSAYLFDLPFYRFLQGWALGVVIVNALFAVGIYAINFALGGFQFQLTPTLRAHLSGLGVVFFLLLAIGYWLSLQELLYSARGAAYGAAYTDVVIRQPALRVLIVISIIVAIVLAANSFLRWQGLPLAAIGIWFLALTVGTGLLPAAVQRFQVQPNEFEREQTYIERSIEMTREGFALNRIEEQPYDSSPEVITGDIVNANPGTFENIRLWDHRPLRDIYNQIQFFRLQYSFLDIDIDRYTIDGDYRQVMVGTRELVQSQLDPQAQTWVNERLQYTHGYGAAMSPVTEFTQDGLPEFFLQDIPPEPVTGAPHVDVPQVYFGEATDDWVIVRSTTPEFDHPTDAGPVYRSYEGDGVSISGLLSRVLFAWRFTDLNILITGAITDESQILYYREIQERVGHLAPFLALDSDPYIVVADGKLYWVQDAYTISDRFPYSEPAPSGFNYIRNSVKAVIDAYDGSVDLYIADESDGIIRTYESVFPDLFKPMSEMPEALRSHLRYPEDFFTIQADKYLKFHMTDPQVFYNQEDLWNFPLELFFSDQAQVMEPYYLIMGLPGEEQEEFVLIMPFTPDGKPNLVGWLAARNDGENYGSLIAYTFPKERQIDGPQQVEARITTNPEISQQFTLWDQAGSNVLRGNLLVIPVGDHLMYAEPIYLKAEDIDYPQLTRVVLVQQGEEPVMLPTLSQSLNNLLAGRGGTTAIREPTTPATGTDDMPSDSVIDRLRAELERLRESAAQLTQQIEDISLTIDEALDEEERAA